MRELGLGQIILLIVFILVPLIKFVVQQVKRRFEGKMPRSASATRIRQKIQAEPATLPTPRAARDRVQVNKLQAPVVLPPLEKRHFTRTSLLRTPREVRRGIVLMTILGPCRAFDPPGYSSPNLFLHQEVSLLSRKTEGL